MEGSEQATSMGLDEATWEEYVDCLVPEMQANMSDDGLEAFMDADTDTVVNGGMMDISQEDKEAAEAAFTKCGTELSDAMMEDAGAGSASTV
ncbi:MAG: hypothetical protein ACK5MR_08180 [Cumulibacter sp.]